MKMYMVGGAVRDEILGVPSKDIDYSVVLEDIDWHEGDDVTPFEVMRLTLELSGFKIFLEKPEHLTIRAQFPPTRSAVIGNPPSPLRLTADFVLARKEGTYSDGRRPDSVEPGTLHDDLARRDFTMNAVAKDGESYIDPFDGISDIKRKVIRAVGDPYERLEEDALRAVRAVRFATTLGFTLDPELAEAIVSAPVLNAIIDNISDERIRDEVSKMFRKDTRRAIRILGDYPRLTQAIFAGSVSLDATMKQKGRGVRKQKQGPGTPLPIAHNGCQCRCHKEKGVMHMAACCRPISEEVGND